MSRGRRTVRWVLKRLPYAVALAAAWALARFLHVHAQTRAWGDDSGGGRHRDH